MLFVLQNPLPSFSFSWPCDIHTSLQTYLAEVDHMRTYDHTHDYSRNLIIERSFPRPVFDHLQYAKMEGEGLGDSVTCMT